MQNIKPMPPRDISESLARLEEQFAAHARYTEDKWKHFDETFVPMAEEIKELTEWKSTVQGAWKAVVIVSMVIGFVVGVAIQLK